jgi:hypothetical protein
MFDFDPLMRPSAVELMDGMNLAFCEHWESMDSENFNTSKLRMFKVSEVF